MNFTAKMSDILSRLKKIDFRSKLIVNGFIRESQKLLSFKDNPYYNLNALIIQICLIYYAMTEYWDILADGFITEKNGTVLKKTNNSSNNWSNTSYGKTVMPSIGNCIYEWFIKLDKIYSGFLHIGICDSKCDLTIRSVRWNNFDRYLCHASNGFIASRKASGASKLSKGIKFWEGCVLSIRVDTKKGIIQFHSNSEGSDEEHQSVQLKLQQKVDLSYRLAASICCATDYITITKLEMHTA